MARSAGGSPLRADATKAAALQPCPKCGTTLEVKGSVPGSWLICPSCAQPMQVRGRVVSRPKPEPQPEQPEVAWIDDPRVAEPRFPLPTSGQTVAAAAEVGFQQAELTPPPDGKPWKLNRRRRQPILILTLVAAIGNTLFAGLFMPISSAEELLGAGAFGGLLGLFVASMASAGVRPRG